MTKAVLMTVLLAGLIVISTSGPAWAAQLDTTINPNNAESPFKMSYLKTVFIEYPNGGDLFNALGGTQWKTAGTADATNPAIESSNPNVLASALIPVGSNKKCQLVNGCSKIKSALINSLLRTLSASVPTKVL